MPFLKVLREHDHAFEPQAVSAMAGAFEDALQHLGLVRRDDAVTREVARLTIEIAKTGERDRGRLADAVVATVRRREPPSGEDAIVPGEDLNLPATSNRPP
jgi:hypothetical protein